MILDLNFAILVPAATSLNTERTIFALRKRLSVHLSIIHLKYILGNDSVVRNQDWGIQTLHVIMQHFPATTILQTAPACSLPHIIQLRTRPKISNRDNKTQSEKREARLTNLPVNNAHRVCWQLVLRSAPKRQRSRVTHRLHHLGQIQVAIEQLSSGLVCVVGQNKVHRHLFLQFQITWFHAHK